MRGVLAHFAQTMPLQPLLHRADIHILDRARPGGFRHLAARDRAAEYHMPQHLVVGHQTGQLGRLSHGQGGVGDVDADAERCGIELLQLPYGKARFLAVAQCLDHFLLTIDQRQRGGLL